MMCPEAAQAAVALQAEYSAATIVMGFGELAVDGLEVESPLVHEAEALCFSLKAGTYALGGARSALRDSVEFGEALDTVVTISGLRDQESTHYAPLVGREEPLPPGRPCCFSLYRELSWAICLRCRSRRNRQVSPDTCR